MAPQAINSPVDNPVRENPPPSGLRTRVLSALVLAPIALGLTYLGGAPFNLMLLVVAVLMAHEWNRLCGGGTAAMGAVIIIAVLASVGIAALGLMKITLGVILLAAVLAFAIATNLVGMAQRRPLWLAAGVLYVSVPCIAVIWLRAAPESGLATILWLLAVIWATDIGAYFAGRGIGGPKLAPQISPKKTWAGLAGGMIAAAVVGAVTATLLGGTNLMGLVLFSILLAVISQGGDLLESGIKRYFKVKDSGNLIPGHGGLLDRLDGLMTAAPTVAAVALIGGDGVLA